MGHMKEFNIKQRLNKLLKQKNITPEKLSAISNISKTVIKGILNGRNTNPRISDLYLIAKALNVNTEDLVSDGPILDIELDTNKIDIIRDALDKIKTVIIKHNVKNINLNTLLVLLKEIFSYSKDIGYKKVDMSFIEWLIKKNIYE